MNRRIVWVCASLALVMLVAAADAQQQGRGQRGQRGQGQEGAQAHDYTGKDTKGIEDIVNDAIAQKSWRADAYERIDQYRKADLAITVKDASGRVLPNAEITIEQTDHEFPFGMVASARRIVGVGETSDLYRKILPYFANKLCLENSLKQRHGPSNEERTREVFRWAKEHGFEIRGHNLIWPHARFLPMDVETFVYGKTHTSYNEHIASEPLDLSEAQKEELRNMVAQKIADWAAKWDVPDWDVINEPRVNHHLMDILGKEVIVDWFKIAREHAVRPDAGLILNENRVISGGPEEYEDNINNYMGWIQLLVDHDAPITGIGFQARMNHDISAEEIWRRLNLFNKFGLPLSITEMQVQRRNDPSLKEYKKAELIERAMTLYFSHPMVDQIFQWDLMARGEKRNMDEEELSQTQMRAGRALVWSDGSLKLNGKIYLWLINNHWRTNETVKTDENGTVQLRGFKGTYKIRAKHNGQSIDLGTLQLPEGGYKTELTADIN